MPMTPRRILHIVLWVAALAIVTVTASTDFGAPARSAPTVMATTPIDFPGLLNVVTYAEGVMSGAQPEDLTGLESLAALGVRTIVSVDGGTPNVEAAERLGMRYVHLPISYDEVPIERQREFAQVLAHFDAPIYMHCLHGRHRSAAALGSALIAAGRLDYAAVEARMQVSGTSLYYPGLWASLRECEPLDGDALRADPATFPRVSEVTGLVATMAELDTIFDNLQDARAARWTFSEAHPDLVAASESKRLVTLFEGLVDDPDSTRLPQHYQDQLLQAIGIGRQLDEAVRSNAVERATERLAALERSCKTCHTDYRDR